MARENSTSSRTSPSFPTPAPAPRSLRERFGALRNLPPFLKLVWQTSPALTAGDLSLRLVRALLPVATLYVGKLIIDEVVRLAQAPRRARRTCATGWRAGWLDRISAGCWRSSSAWRCSPTCSAAPSRCSTRSSPSSSRNATSLRLMEHAATLDLEDFEDSELQDRLERARRQAAGRMTLMSQLFGQAQDVVTIVSFAAGLVVYAPWLIVLLVAGAGAGVPRRGALQRAELLAQLRAHAGAARARLRAPDRRQRRDREGSEDLRPQRLPDRALPRSSPTRFYQDEPPARDAPRRLGQRCSTALGTVGYYVAYAYIAWRTLQRRVHASATSRSSPARSAACAPCSRALLIGFSQVAGQALYLDDLFSFFEIEPEIVSPANPRPFPTPIREGFVFEDVGFRYPGAERWAVRHLTFTLRAGEVLALVGENGAGKTTLVKLLARLYDPDEGRILLDGHDLREYDLDALRANIGVIFQDFVRYHLTAAENIAVGRIEARDDRARIVARRRAQPRRRGDREAAGRLRPDHRQALPHRRRPLGRRVAEDRHRARLHARRPGADPRRADRGARRARRSSRCSSASRS